jgi:hypothetical protein
MREIVEWWRQVVGPGGHLLRDGSEPANDGDDVRDLVTALGALVAEARDTNSDPPIRSARLIPRRRP